MGSAAKIAIAIAEPITTKVKGDRACSLELEFVLVGKSLGDGGRIFACNQQVVKKAMDSMSVQTFLAMLAATLGAAVAWSLGARFVLGVPSRLLDGVASAAVARRWRIPVSGNFVNTAMSG